VNLRFTILDVWNQLTAEGDDSSMFDVGRSMFNVSFLTLLLIRHIQDG